MPISDHLTLSFLSSSTLGFCTLPEGGDGTAKRGVEEGARGVEEGGVAGGSREDAERGCGGVLGWEM